MNPALDPNDAKLFYDLWMPLLDYVNQVYHVNSNLGRMTQANGLDIREVMVVSGYLWSHSEIIDKYLAAVNLPDEHKEIISGWKHFVSGRFILERHLKKGSVLINIDDGQVYPVIAPVVRKIFELYNQGKNLADIARMRTPSKAGGLSKE